MMTTLDDLQASVVAGCRRQRNPGGDNRSGFLKPPVGRVLMPGNITFRHRLFGKIPHPPTKNIGTYDSFDHVEQKRVTGQVRRPSFQQIYFLPHVESGWAPGALLPASEV